ncbi:MAG: hypothetical protein LBF86_05645 [Helicobacteraceae bacterium]|jgi:uncharacterized protein with HEPN domain|nr:hypothetical protein [Helicobacteraceae bacterium]
MQPNMQPNDSRTVDFILKRGGEIYAAQKRFGADPSALSSDSAYFNAIATGLLQISIAAKKLSKTFRDGREKVAWKQIDDWSAAIIDRFDTLTALDLWTMLEDLSELYGVCYVYEDSR